MSADNLFSTGPMPFAQQAEALIRTLNGVLMARVIADENDRIQEVHAIVDDSEAPAQFARNIQSALLAQFGALVELENIFINPAPSGLRNGARKHGAGAAAGAPVDAAVSAGVHTYPDGRSGSPDATPYGAISYAAPAPEGMSHAATSLDLTVSRSQLPGAAPSVGMLEIERARTHRVRCRLSIQWENSSFYGTAEVVDGPGAPVEAAARATIAALNGSGRAPLLALEGIRTTEIAGRRYATVAVRAHFGRSVRYLAGAAAIEHSAEDAAADATLQAAAPCLIMAQPGPRHSLAAAS